MKAKEIKALSPSELDAKLTELKDELFKLRFQQAINQHFMRQEHKNIWHVAETPEEAVNLVYTIPHWSKEIRKFAAI